MKHRLTHGSVSLSDTTPHASQQSGNGRTDAERFLRGLFDFTTGKQQDTTFGRRFNPRPGNQPLIESGDASTGHDCLERLVHRLGPVRGHLGLEHLEGLAEGRHFEHVHGRADGDVGPAEALFHGSHFERVCDGEGCGALLRIGGQEVGSRTGPEVGLGLTRCKRSVGRCVEMNDEESRDGQETRE